MRLLLGNTPGMSHRWVGGGRKGKEKGGTGVFKDNYLRCWTKGKERSCQ